jgi:hypothetical protein
MGLPPISASGLRGNLVEPQRAGITTKNSGVCELISIELLALISSKAASFFYEHYRNIVSDGVCQTIRFANKLMLFRIEVQRTFAQRAN